MTRFGIAQIMVATGLVATLGVPTFARDDDPRDFKRNDSRYDNNHSGQNNSSSIARNNDDNEHNRDNYQNGRNNNPNSNNHSNGNLDRDDRDEDRPDRPKVTICHKSEIDDHDDDDDRRSGVRAKSIQVSQNAVAAHLAHGDTLGPCVVSPFRPHKYHKDRD